MDFLEQLCGALDTTPDKIVFEYRSRDYLLSEVNRFANHMITLLERGNVPSEARVGVIVRNRPLHAAVMLGLIAHGRALTTLYAIQSPQAMGAEIEETRFGAVIADARDWTPEVEAAVKATGAAAILLDHETNSIEAAPGFEHAKSVPFSSIEGERGIEILSSGTTGKPKRILFPFRMLGRAVDSVAAARTGLDPEPDILTWPYGGIGGMCNLVAGIILGRHTTLLDKFNVPEWVEAIRKHRPKFLSGPPTVARMALDAGVTREDMASVQYFFGGGAAFSPELQDEFEAAYDIKVIWAYGATEFCGTIISWTPALYETYRDTKRGAIGKALAGISLRVTDVDTGEPLPPGEVGYLEAIVPTVSDDWIRTTDLMVIDEDGFAFHRGRGDGAIVRGGFKVLPEKVVAALQQHPSVLDAAVVGLPDARLGEVPVAAVELRENMPRVAAEELREHMKQTIVAHHVPAQILVLDRLPRTTSLKADLGAIRQLFLAST
ncbi:MAG: long-chain fatty acid--CoA ligase [Sphingomonadales bacterium]|nr:MAG: long-chain fatty acid--CoA ligase [Sphingomonadales bacterium]